MSTFDRITNLAKGAVSDGRKRFEDGGGLEGLARRAGERARGVADAARDAAVAAQDDLAERTSAGTFARDVSQDNVQQGAVQQDNGQQDNAWAAARQEVESLRPRRSREAKPQETVQVDAFADRLASLDRRHRSGDLDKSEWLAQRARLLDELDRSHRTEKGPRRRTL